MPLYAWLIQISVTKVRGFPASPKLFRDSAPPDNKRLVPDFVPAYSLPSGHFIWSLKHSSRWRRVAMYTAVSFLVERCLRF